MALGSIKRRWPSHLPKPDCNVTSTRQRRAGALVSLIAGTATIAFALSGAVRGFPRGLSVLACLLIALFAAFEGVLRHRGVAQLIAIVVAVAASAGALAVILLEGRLLEDLLIVVGTAVSIAAAEVAFTGHVHLPKAPPPSRPFSSTTPSPAVARQSNSTSPRRRGRAASSQSSCGRATISVHSCGTR